ncbi:hypothetical protein HD600_000211 [Microbacterium ginsengiterrae]|uniref:Uncharacterized protein n=1 Tax=Microbacterium ginsengiterrae TaxID=546115 RepID=A0A7W9C9V7_9MICO|nr:hypothetical protein [Microbacterium ginsengiterrae]MBB5741714.1 hypothetical protein [Microbacterium ginsengiterrae]
MVEYRNHNNEVVDMEAAVVCANFTVAWVDAEVECTRLEFDALWAVRRTVGGITAAYGKVARKDHAFYWVGHPNAYNTFDEAARKIITPV